ncbi:MAG: sulfite exporter TauE/SafE family protein [Clostridia bacterium]|nr:sulfite exporter TauE/SafE family protein [Clostridia bacterium]
MISIIAGFLSGIISGMGIGGGMLLIPALVFFLFVPQQTAQAINLWYFIPTAIIALCIHAKNKDIELKKSACIILSGVPCALFGAYLALRFDSALLGKLFGGFLAFFGAKEIYDGFTNKK